MVDKVKEYLGALVAMPMLAHVAWTDPLVWPCAFLFAGLTVCWVFSKLRAWSRASR